MSVFDASPGAPFIQVAGPFEHERRPGRRVLGVGRTRGGSALTSTRARWGDIVASGRRPDPAAGDRLAADLARALREQQAAGPAARAGRDAWRQRRGGAS